jgi:glycosyltransferase involved in cell wall biosynthesis
VFFAHNYHGTCISGSKCVSFPTHRPCDRRFGSACLAHYLPRRCGGLSPFTMIRSYRLNRRRLEVLGDYSQVVTHSDSLTLEYMRHGIDCERLRFFASLGAGRPRGETEWSPSASWRLLMIGRMISNKGGELLLDALPILSKSLNRPICLTMAGDGPSRCEWEKQAARIRMRCPEVEISFTGWVTGARRERILRESDLLVVPSVWPEPFGIGGIEAGVFRPPPAGLRGRGIPDWLFDGRIGARAPADRLDSPSLADAVWRCLSDEATYRRLRAGAFEMSEQMTVESHYEDLMVIFDRLKGTRARDVSANSAVAAAQGTAL